MDDVSTFAQFIEWHQANPHRMAGGLLVIVLLSMHVWHGIAYVAGAALDMLEGHLADAEWEKRWKK